MNHHYLQEYKIANFCITIETEEKLLFLILIFPADIQPTSKEVESGTDATLTCSVTGVTKELDAVVWTKDGTDVTKLTEDNSYVVSVGTYGSNSQTTVLTVKAAVNTADSTYTCVITSNEWLVTNQETSVILNVFGENS